MAIQDTLFIVGLSLLGLGVLLLGAATYVFFNRNIRDIIADLNGTKRAEALEAMAKESGRSRRRPKAGEATGALAEGAPTAGVVGVAQMENHEPVVETTGDADDTTVMQEDSADTTVLDPDAADATTLLESVDSESSQEADETEATSVASAVKKEEAAQETIPDSFHIVRKIVLSQSAEFIKPEQGDDYA